MRGHFDGFLLAHAAVTRGVHHLRFLGTLGTLGTLRPRRHTGAQQLYVQEADGSLLLLSLVTSSAVSRTCKVPSWAPPSSPETLNWSA